VAKQYILQQNWLKNWIGSAA